MTLHISLVLENLKKIYNFKVFDKQHCCKTLGMLKTFPLSVPYTLCHNIMTIMGNIVWVERNWRNSVQY